MLAAWVGAQAGFATVLEPTERGSFIRALNSRIIEAVSLEGRLCHGVSGLGRCPVLGLGIGLVLVLAVDVELKYIISTMISVGHRSLSGRAIRLIIWSTEFESQIDLFLFNIKLFYKFSKSLIIRLFKALMKLPLSVG